MPALRVQIPQVMLELLRGGGLSAKLAGYGQSATMPAANVPMDAWMVSVVSMVISEGAPMLVGGDRQREC